MQIDALQKKYSIGEAAEFLGVSIDTLRRWEKAGKIKTLRSPGGHRYFLKSDLEGAFGQRYSRSTPSQEAAIPTQILQEDTSIAPEQVSSSPISEPSLPSNLDLEQKSAEQSLQNPDPAGQIPDDTANLTPQEVPAETASPESPITAEPIASQHPQTPEKRYTVEEIASPSQTTDISSTQKITPKVPETYTPDISKTPISPASESEQITETQKFDEPLASFNTPPTSLSQSEIQSSQTEVPEVTVTPQQKKSGSTLKKVSLFLLIVFMMVNIILIGFYIFVSRQL